MRGLIVTHGKLGRALIHSAELILGPQSGLDALSNENLNPDELRGRILDWLCGAGKGAAAGAAESAAANGTTGAGAGCPADFTGGSCYAVCRRAIETCRERTASSGEVGEASATVPVVLTGVNLPMILTFLTCRQGTKPEELVELVKDRGRKGIRC